ncbi:hypothetical protein ACVGVM_13550 [Pseudonocardia bannensis]|nr:hypothetical protein [Pseudonocardia bannensis]
MTACWFHRPRFLADMVAHGFVSATQWIHAVWQYGIVLLDRAPYTP